MTTTQLFREELRACCGGRGTGHPILERGVRVPASSRDTARTERTQHVVGRTAFRITMGRVATRQSVVEFAKGPGVSAAPTALPTSRATRIEPQPFPHGCRGLRQPLSPCATANVATDLTSLAIIEQLAPGWVLGKRGFPVSAGRRTRFHPCLHPRSGPC